MENNVNEFLNDLDLKYEQPVFCPKCFTTHQDFLNTGFVGCANCYKVFKKQVDSFINSCQFSNKHIGKIYTSNLSCEQKLRELNLELDLAIKEQRFEDCANLKRKIDSLKEQQNYDR